MKFTAEQLVENWDKFNSIIDTYISEPRKSQLKAFYDVHAERFVTMPASSKASYHNAFPGGYVDHVCRVVYCALQLESVWEDMGANLDNFTREELVFAALNHDLGKMGTTTSELYIPSQDQWRKDKLGEVYTMNPEIDYTNIPDRSLWILQDAGIKVTMNEMIAIRTHDGLYDEANKSYFVSYNPESRFKTLMPLILHQADLMAANIEFQSWKLNQPSKPKFEIKSNATAEGRKQNQVATKTQALGKLQNPGLKNLMSDFFND
jgi:hypothetical protein